jgi:hypothetical protein
VAANRRKLGFLSVALVVIVALVVGIMHFNVLDRLNPNKKEEQYHSIGGNVAEQKDGPSLKATPATVKGAMPFAWAVNSLGTTVHITPDGALPKPVTLRFTLNHAVKNPGDVLIASNETGKSKDWVLRKPNKVDGKYAYITVTRLSWWEPVLRDAQALLNAFKDEMRKGFDALTGDATTVSEPAECEGESTAKAKGYTIKAQGDSVHYCLGWKNNAPYMKEINNRRYALQIQHPGLDAKYVKNTTLDLSELARLGNGKWTILSAFDGAEFNLKKMPAGTQAEFGGEANALYQLQFGVETLINIMTRFGAGGGVIKNGAITLTSADRIAEFTSKFLQVKDCGSQIFNPGDVSFGSLLSKCFDPATLGDIFGWRGVLVGAVMVVGPLVEFFRSQFDALGDMLNGHDKTTIIVSYQKPNPLAKYTANHWHRHESGFDVAKDGTATMYVGFGAGEIPGCGYWCTFNANLKVTPNSDGTLTGTYTKVWFSAANSVEDSKLHDIPTPPASVSDPFPHAGDTTTIKTQPDNQLNISGLGDPGSDWCGPNSKSNCGA